MSLRQRLGNLPQELFDEIKELVFTVKPGVRVIDQGWSPPHFLHHDRESREWFSKSYFANGSTFLFPCDDSTEIFYPILLKPFLDMIDPAHLRMIAAMLTIKPRRDSTDDGVILVSPTNYAVTPAPFIWRDYFGREIRCAWHNHPSLGVFANPRQIIRWIDEKEARRLLDADRPKARTNQEQKRRKALTKMGFNSRPQRVR